VPGASKDARYDQLGSGCALSSHSIMTRGQRLARLTLADALRRGELDRFVTQAETAMMCSRQACSSGNRWKNSRTENSGLLEGDFLSMPIVWPNG
jgi:hypothetical protein